MVVLVTVRVWVVMVVMAIRCLTRLCCGGCDGSGYPVEWRVVVMGGGSHYLGGGGGVVVRMVVKHGMG